MITILLSEHRRLVNLHSPRINQLARELMNRDVLIVVNEPVCAHTLISTAEWCSLQGAGRITVAEEGHDC